MRVRALALVIGLLVLAPAARADAFFSFEVGQRGWGVMLTCAGAGVFLVGYLTPPIMFGDTEICTGPSCGKQFGLSLIPIAGPWLTFTEPLTEGLMIGAVVGGVMEIVGLAMIMGGAAMILDADAQEGDPTKASAQLVPWITRDSGGLALFGVF